MSMSQRDRLLPLSLALALVACQGAELASDRDTDPLSEPPDAGDVSSSDGASPPGDTLADGAEPGDDGTEGDGGGDIDDPVTPAEWEPVILGDLGGLDAVSAVSADAIWAVSGPRVLRWNGASWLTFGSPAGEDQDASGEALHGVWSDGVTVVVVGDGGLIARRPASGVTPWARESSGTTVDLWAVAGRGPADLVAAGDDGVVLRDTGAGWEKRHERTGLRLRGVYAGAGEGDAGLRAVGSGGLLVEATGGVWRSSQIARSASTLSGFGVLADGTLLAVGTAHTLTARRPTAPAWQGETSNDTRERDVGALVTLADGSVRAFGADGLLLRRDDAGLWQLEAVPEAGVLGFSAAAGFGTGSSAGLMALARDGGGLMLRSGAWSRVTTRPDVAIRGLAVDRDGQLWAAGTRGTLLVRSDAQGFSALPLPTDGDLHAVAADPAGGVWAVGSGGRLLQITATGALSAITLPVPVDLHDVAVTEDAVVAVGRGGTALIWDRAAETVRFLATGTVADLQAVVVEGAGDDRVLWIAGAYGTVLRGPFLGAAGSGLLEALETGTGASLRDLALDGDGAAWAVGDGGVILRIDPSADPDNGRVSLVHEEAGLFLQGVATRDGGVIAVGAGGAIRVRARDAATFSAERPAARSGNFAAVTIDADGAVWLGSNQRGAGLERRRAPWGQRPDGEGGQP